ncbi:hypothetical protein NM688_g3236 [Phlebia brevispora]|uniref:Uncharacterized protein n=1 Tax=Phlebia brevispora TaxID=194682 RepID=A0ACC1T690_9APHY|nr:hypothetical protein NM688_g3236 [Phlebia brevispora]
MRSHNSYYPAPRSEDQVLKMWMRPGRAANASWGSATLVNDENSSPVSDEDDGKFTGPQCAWASSSSSSTATDSDPSASGLSIATSPRVVDLPEIPFISTGVPIDRKGSGSTFDDDDSRSNYWPHAARSSPSWDRQQAILGETPERHFNQGRGRSSSLSSTASRPAPAKSILSSSSSIRTRKGRSPPSVKFLEMPTVHFEEEGECDEFDEEPTWPRVSIPRSPMPYSPPPEVKKNPFAWLKRLTIPVQKKKPETAPVLQDRPLISAPMPLWEAPRNNTFPRRNTVSSGPRSIRSVKSSASLRSVRSCASRLQVYWGKLGTKEP